ncbi:TetR/AcrR family transcriptional regulator [Flavobacterium psychrophilum]|uniref:TetR/AcrR family transcriptional regulator n=1 Tax=Flavobacterium psychrophilum TaxID=96345 RepID=UPI000B7C1D11|nr:TetR/AcrR family transcriptional regulator [Flavobacterium psychrophilum]QRE62476.1 TetR/AcrR family transcriptional regulator [Flavobacterium psychrophilum]QRE64664.1 TetR/AcrR family transcriptional regulator [Flavobacterium psychrophilum]SNB35825.1 putative transcriptional regulator, TetR family [Flavobacterium psychrophilum]
MIKKEKITDKKNALLNATLTLVNNHGFHDAPMSKIAKLAGVATATIYLYFDSKQDLINTLYLEVKTSFSNCALEGYNKNLPVKKGFEMIWYNIADYKLNKITEAKFLSQCDSTPMIDDEVQKEGLKHLQPLLDLWEKGKEEGIIKPISNFVLYAYAIYPLSFLMSIQERSLYTLNKKTLNETFQLAWDAIKV